MWGKVYRPPKSYFIIKTSCFPVNFYLTNHFLSEQFTMIVVLYFGENSINQKVNLISSAKEVGLVHQRSFLIFLRFKKFCGKTNPIFDIPCAQGIA